MIVKAKTVYTPEMVNECRRFFRKLPQVKVASLILWFLPFSFSYIFYITRDIGLIIVFAIYYSFVLVLFMVTHVEAKRIDCVCIFEFSENKVVLERTDSWGGKVETDYKYYNRVVYETNDYFYFFSSSISGSSYFILRKADITEGSVSGIEQRMFASS